MPCGMGETNACGQEVGRLPCYACAKEATGIAWVCATYYWACPDHETARPLSVPRTMFIEAADRLRRARRAADQPASE